MAAAGDAQEISFFFGDRSCLEIDWNGSGQIFVKRRFVFMDRRNVVYWKVGCVDKNFPIKPSALERSLAVQDDN